MNSTVFSIGLRFCVLIFAQALIFNEVDFIGIYDPFVAILFLFLYPVSTSQVSFLITSFCFGLGLDLFLMSGGIQATSFLVAAFLRPAILRFTFGISYDYHDIRIGKSSAAEQITTLGLLVLTHHVVMYSFIAFSWSRTLWVIERTFVNGVLTGIVCLMLFYLIKKDGK